MLNKIQIEFQNCYGIRELKSTLNFNGKSAIAIYAPNGTMKTSFAKTFFDLQSGDDSIDAVFPSRPSSRKIAKENGTNLVPTEVIVVLSYNEELAPSESTSTLLVNSTLRKEYESIQAELISSRNDLLKAVKATAGTKGDVSRQISRSFTKEDDKFYIALTRIEEELKKQNGTPFAEVPYDVIFNDQVRAITTSSGFGTALKDYVTKLNELLDNSKFFSRESFSYYNANNVTKSLNENKYFQASHSLTLKGLDGNDVVVTDAQQLSDLVAAEQMKITEDEALREKLGAIKKKLEKNAATRAFYDYVADHVEILPELDNIELFEEKLWKSYLKANESLYFAVIEQWRKTDMRMSEIESQAASEGTQWEKVIEMFNDRFFVPFRLTAKNKNKVVLGSDPVLKLGFEFDDGRDRKSIEKGELLEVLSNGEKKALYILNVLFEVEARKNSNAPSLFIIDDLADSFDYKNKYAIVQYLHDMSYIEHFQLVILTHNFDFFRTLNSRGIASYKNCLTAQRTANTVELIPAAGIKNPFIHDLKPKFFEDDMKRVASIPFVRNIVEYTRGESDPDYLKLTSVLHWKPDTASITNADLDAISNSTFGTTGAHPTPASSIVDMVLTQAKVAAAAPEGINFENKIVLSMAIRILAEKHMIGVINDDQIVKKIVKNQTHKLCEEYVRRNLGRAQQRNILDSVVLMTPENLHVNSFMYEPIIDMADEHLRKLFCDVLSLDTGGDQGYLQVRKRSISRIR